jgi:hypothetical protein
MGSGLTVETAQPALSAARRAVKATGESAVFSAMARAGEV